MISRFRDRAEAGRLLARELSPYAGRTDLLVLALPRGGVPVAFEVARHLGAPLDVFVVRKLGVPGQEELAMGAVAAGGLCVVNEALVKRLGIDPAAIDAEAAAEGRELERRESLYRAGRPPIDVRGRTVILVDDGLATGATMHAAVLALRSQHPAAVVVAAPVGAPATCAALSGVADDCVCVLQPPGLDGVGRWYEDFTQTEDAEVRALLERAGAAPAA
jgi:predicted phosphoribosyltransferase